MLPPHLVGGLTPDILIVIPPVRSVMLLTRIAGWALLTRR